jgi:RNase P/RNase MRP subunit p30
MPRRYVDAWIRPASPSLATQMLERAAELGYSALAIEAADPVWESAKNEARNLGIEAFRRVTMSPRSVEEMYRRLSEERWRYDYVAVATDSRDILMAAVRDMRVDSVVVSLPGLPRIDRHVVSVTNNAYEVSLAHIIEHEFRAYKKALHAVRVASKKVIKLVASSGASDVLSLRRPLQLASILWASGSAPSAALDAISSTAMTILENNRARREGRLDPQGVWRLVEE